VLESSLAKAGFKNIQIERQNVTFEFASVKDYINHIQDIAAPLKVILDKESKNRREEMWTFVKEEVAKSNYTNPDDGSVRMDNECICVVGTRLSNY
jgi:enediyne biosynthesis protein CalE5